MVSVERDLGQEVQRLRALYRLSQMVTASLDLDTTLDAIAGAAHQLTPSTLTAILLLDSQDSLTIRVARGTFDSAVGERIPAGQGIVGRALTEGRTVLVADMLQEDSRARPDLDERFNVRAYAAAPLIWDGTPLGAITLGSTTPGGLTQADVELVSQLAAAAVAHARAFRAEQQRRTQSEALAQQLAHQTAQLSRVQQQLVQAEKMTAIGQLVDGIAHEMNTPLGVLVSNLSVLDEYATRLIGVAEGARKALGLLPPGGDANSARAVLQAALGSSPDELAYLLGDLPELISESTTAASKVADIVRSMAVFARGDDAQRPVSVNLEDVLESALTLAWNPLKHRAQVVRDFQPAAPIMGHSSELIQMFLHLLLNAAQALENCPPGVVSVRIEQIDGMVTVSIADTGPGVPPEHLARVFDPFFTTREPGRGTGMGLTVCHGIVTRHGGSIALRNVPGGGAEAVVRLPLADQGLLQVSQPCPRPTVEVRR